MLPFEPIKVNTQENIDALVANLRSSTAKGTAFQVGPYEVDSWKFNDWDYNKPDMPCYARGLFTCLDEATGHQTIAVRGYDKFFSVDEVRSTKREAIINGTEGPYEVSTKENGCIAFISTLPNGELIVCSKHSTGARKGLGKNHATRAETALEKQLARKNISKEQLAKALTELKCTAVVEYCDDEFEEHVLPYRGDRSGLYLHGLNLNTTVFKTYPLENVNAFANVFGFLKVDYFVEHSVDKLLAFLEECAKTGTYKGHETEGFVVRCKRNGLDFFFKFKFDEPYLLYRQFREVTKEFINGKEVGKMKIKNHRLIVLDYLSYVIPILKEDERLRKRYLENHGIVELRDAYLKHRGKKGIELINENDLITLSESIQAQLKVSQETKYVLVPVATIGCGKTTTAVTLLNLFPEWTHVQSDDVPAPVKDKMVRRALELLIGSPLVIVDRNNHMYRERAQIFEHFETLGQELSHCKFEFICLNFKVSDNRDKVWDLTTKRVLARGDNHQSIKVEADGQKHVEGIMKGFFKRYQPVDATKKPDSLFDLVIDLPVEDENSTINNVNLVISSLKKHYPELVKEVPGAEQVKEAFAKALQYKPTVTKHMKKSEKKLKALYFGIEIDKQLPQIVEQTLTPMPVMWQTLKDSNRVQDMFHITLIHRKEGRENKSVLDFYSLDLFKEKRKLVDTPSNTVLYHDTARADIALKRLFWNDRLVCIEAEIVSARIGDNELSLPIANKPNSDKPRRMHITLGTASNGIPPVESNTLLTNFYDSQDGTIQFMEFPETILRDQKLFMFCA